MRVTTCRRNADEQDTHFIIKMLIDYFTFISSFYVILNDIECYLLICSGSLLLYLVFLKLSINPFSQRKHADIVYNRLLGASIFGKCVPRQCESVFMCIENKRCVFTYKCISLDVDLQRQTCLVKI